MGKDQSKDGNAATSSTAENREPSQDQESRDAALARTITVTVAGALTQQKSEEHSPSLKHSPGRWRIHSPSLKHSQGKWRRCMHSMRSF